MENMPMRKKSTSKFTTAGIWCTERGPGTTAMKAARDMTDQVGSLGNLDRAAMPATTMSIMTTEYKAS